MTEKRVPVLIRIPEEVRDRIAALAASERRSMNSQIVVMLEKAALEKA